MLSFALAVYSADKAAARKEATTQPITRSPSAFSAPRLSRLHLAEMLRAMAVGPYPTWTNRAEPVTPCGR
jgi:hypothetical protein